MEIRYGNNAEVVIHDPDCTPYKLTEREHGILISYGKRSAWVRDGDLWCRNIIHVGRSYTLWYRSRSCRYSELVKAPLAIQDRRRLAGIPSPGELRMIANSGEWALDLDTMVEEKIG